MKMNLRRGVERISRCQNQGPVSPWDEQENNLSMLLWHPAYRRREFTSGLYKEREKLSSRCQGKTSSRSAFKKESTEAWHGGRNFRSSNETPVMGWSEGKLLSG